MSAPPAAGASGPSPARPGLIETAVLSGLAALAPLPMSMYAPSMPALVGVFGTEIGWVQMTLSAYLGAFALGQLLLGPASDRFGRRPVLLIGLAVYMAGSLACAFAWSIGMLIAARVVQALGACAGAAVARAVVRDRYDRDAAVKLLAIVSMVLGLTPAYSPVIGGLIEEAAGWRPVFLVLTGIGAVLWLAVLVLIPESNRRRDPGALAPGRLLGNAGTLLRSRGYRGNMAAAGLSLGASFSFGAAAPFVYMTVLGLDPVAFGLAMIPQTVTYVCGSLVVSRLAGRLGLGRLTLAGLVIQVMAAAALLGLELAGPQLIGLEVDGITGVALVIGAMMGWMLGMALVLPCTTVAAMAPFPHMAGAAWSLIGFSQMALGGLGSLILAAIGAPAIWPVAAVMTGFAVLALALWSLEARA